jgi:hypothetical protein
MRDEDTEFEASLCYIMSPIQGGGVGERKRESVYVCIREKSHEFR